MGKRYALNVPFHHRDIAKLAGAKWDPENRLWVYYGNEIPEELVSYRPRPFSWAAHIDRQINGEKPPVIEGKRTLSPRPDQLDAIQRIREAHRQGAPGFLLADELGLGKTLVAWESLSTIIPPGSKVAIVVPLSVIGNWVSTLMDRGTRGQDIILLNYDRLRVFFDVPNEPRNKDGSRRKIFKGRTLKGVARFGEAETVDYLIFDECARLKNPQAARSKFAFRLYSGSRFITWISATPGQTPVELAYLLPLLRYRTEGRAGDTCTIEAIEAWAAKNGIGIKQGAFGQLKWEHDEEKDRKVAQILFGPAKRTCVALRREPGSIAGWPELQRILQPIDLDEEDEDRYNQTWEELRAAVLQTSVADRKKVTSPAMVALTRFRQKASLIKVPYTADMVESILENNHRVAISCEFLDTVRALEQELGKRKIKVASVTGEISSPEQRQAIIDKFNRGDVSALIFTVCEGINLQQNALLEKDIPRTQIDHDQRWSGLQMSQIDGRCHRNGKFARVYWLYIRGTADEDVIERVLQRLRGIELLVGDERQLVKDIEEQFFRRAENSRTKAADARP